MLLSSCSNFLSPFHSAFASLFAVRYPLSCASPLYFLVPSPILSFYHSIFRYHTIFPYFLVPPALNSAFAFGHHVILAAPSPYSNFYMLLQSCLSSFNMLSQPLSLSFLHTLFHTHSHSYSNFYMFSLCSRYVHSLAALFYSPTLRFAFHTVCFCCSAFYVAVLPRFTSFFCHAPTALNTVTTPFTLLSLPSLYSNFYMFSLLSRFVSSACSAFRFLSPLLYFANPVQHIVSSLSPAANFYMTSAISSADTLFSLFSQPLSSASFSPCHIASSPHSPFANFYMTLFSAYLLLPLYATISFYVLSFDVIHSFGYHSFGFKSDAIPGRVNSVAALSFFVPGFFSSYCYELCGSSHTSMLSSVIVLS